MKLKSKILPSLLLFGSVLSLTSCLPNIQKEKIIEIKNTIEKNQKVMLLDDMVEVILGSKDEALLNKFKQEQTPSDEWKGNLTLKVEEYEKLFRNPKVNAKDLEKVDVELSKMINEKWYWYLNHLREFEYNFYKVDDFFDFKIKKWNLEFNQEYKENRDSITKIYKSSQHYYPVSNQPVQVLSLDEIDGDSGGQFYLKFNDQFYLPFNYQTKYNTDGSRLIIANIGNNIYRFSTNKIVNIRTYHRFWHNFAYHSNLPSLMEQLTPEWQNFVKSSGYVLNYKITGYGKNKYLPGV
ncbi:aromatic motif membrane protein [Mycoplasma crocodyli]|uniref:Putative lipoprotein n=1 Tax=Mycoplasma crocodyli (strain ATCC 51981 / MP145) TaxID=512564 RepID=D5E5W1_MYCCM|nr:aromatic motif membrane protein [Mycoplasma crocodyli]ADE19807.1 putative lipoprotein [Mycoplasma crocodyli MP145]